VSAPAFNPTVAFSEAQLAGVLAWLGLGEGAATVEIYGTDQPETPGDDPGGSPLVVIALQSPAGEIDAGFLVLFPTEDALIAASGGAVWGRLRNGAGEVGFDAAVTDSDGDGPIRIPSTTLFEGGSTRIVAGSSFGF
jgi:hypothetical protein